MVSLPVDLGARYYERDRDSFASVLGSAVAFRLFLFFVPLLLLVVGAAALLVGGDVVSADAGDVGISGQLANEIDEALETGGSTAWLLVVLGLFGAVWAARSLTRALSAASASAWRLDARSGRTTVTMVAITAGTLAATMLAMALLNWWQTKAGLVGITTSAVGFVGVYSGSWFVVSLALPRSTPDPGAALPGAVMVGVTGSVMHWFAQFYVPARFSSKSEVMGGLAVSVVAMGWLFITGRVMVTSLVLDAVVFERIGSVSKFAFGLPVLRRIPRRWHQVAVYFDLDAEGTDTEVMDED